MSKLSLPPFKLVGFAGPSGSGKSYAATCLEKTLTCNYTASIRLGDRLVRRVSLGSFIRREVEWLRQGLVLESDIAELSMPIFTAGELEHLRSIAPDVIWVKPTDDIIRRILQIWGTDYRRSINPNYWTGKLHQHIVETVVDSEHHPLTFLVDDIRFQNEVDLLRQLGGRVYYINCLDNPSTAGKYHASEQLSPGICDKVLTNHSTVVGQFEHELEQVVTYIHDSKGHVIHTDCIIR